MIFFFFLLRCREVAVGEPKGRGTGLSQLEFEEIDGGIEGAADKQVEEEGYVERVRFEESV